MDEMPFVCLLSHALPAALRLCHIKLCHIKRVESILDFQLTCQLHSGTKCLHTWYKLQTICIRM